MQQVLHERIDSSVDGEIRVEDAFGNRYWHATVEASELPLMVSITTSVRRLANPELYSVQPLNEEKQKFLQANALVPVDHEILQPILAEIRAASSDDPASRARAIYDWVVDNVEYKKVGKGWGNGDTFWACSERYGNCTDFHSLFISLARSEGIAAKFEMGFPVPLDKESGTIGGYHCWVQFYLPGQGWVPIDASEAAKRPELRDYYYGSHPVDRVHFSTGRDIVFQGQGVKPLNYFIYPHVETGGEAYPGAIHAQFSFSAAE